MNTYRILMGKPPGKWVLARPSGSCEDNIKLECRDIGCGDGRCVRLSQDCVQWQVLVIQELGAFCFHSDL